MEIQRLLDNCLWKDSVKCSSPTPNTRTKSRVWLKQRLGFCTPIESDNETIMVLLGDWPDGSTEMCVTLLPGLDSGSWVRSTETLGQMC